MDDPVDNSEPLPWAVLHSGVFTVCACPHPQAAAQAAVVGPITLGYYCYLRHVQLLASVPIHPRSVPPIPAGGGPGSGAAVNTLLRPCVPDTFVCTRICPTNPPTSCAKCRP